MSGFRENEAKILKSGRVTFETLLAPNFIPNFGKILGTVFEKRRYARTYARICKVMIDILETNVPKSKPHCSNSKPKLT